MGPETMLELLRSWIGTVAWRVFLWSLRQTADEYWQRIYEQERTRLFQPADAAGEDRR